MGHEDIYKEIKTNTTEEKQFEQQHKTRRQRHLNEMDRLMMLSFHRPLIFALIVAPVIKYETKYIRTLNFMIMRKKRLKRNNPRAWKRILKAQKKLQKAIAKDPSLKKILAKRLAELEERFIKRANRRRHPRRGHRRPHRRRRRF